MIDVTVLAKNDTDTENTAKERLQKLFKQYDLSQYVFTETVYVEDRAIPHSHPVLTLSSFPYSDKNILLDAFIHEQLHWYLDSQPQTQDAINDLAAKFPHAPWGFPMGCKDQQSTYEHLLLCALTHSALQALVGTDAAERVLHYLQNHHYIWVYMTIKSEREYINTLINKHRLRIH